MSAQVYSRQVLIPVPEAAKEFAKNAKALWKSGELCDLKLIVENIPIDCHKIILAASSEFLEEKLDKVDSYTLPSDLNYEDATTLINFCYTGELPDDFKLAIRLFPHAQALEITHCVDLLVRIIQEHLNADNALEMREFARKINCKSLERVVYSYINKELDLIEIKNPLGFHNISFEDMLELVKDDDTVIYEYKLFNCVLSWLCYDEARFTRCSELLAHVRYISFMPDYIDELKEDQRMQRCPALRDFRKEVVDYLEMDFDEREKVSNAHTVYRKPELVNLHEAIN